jgi:hypothetical protein
MRFLIDKTPEHVSRKAASPLVLGQLLTPLTRYKDWGGVYAIDNGAFSRFDGRAFASLLRRQEPSRDRCLFVAVPDIVANGRRTLEIWQHRDTFAEGWPLALVAQDGVEDMDIPWDEMAAIFIGGTTDWKDSGAVADIVKTAKTLGKHVHIGRINATKRFRRFDRLGADTCDGTGVSQYDHMLAAIERGVAAKDHPVLFDREAIA